MDSLRKLIDENPHFTDMLNHLAECFYIVDRDGKILFINHAAEDFEKISNAEVNGKHIDEIYTQNQSPTLKALKTSKVVDEFENVYMIEGKEFRQMAKSVPIFDRGKLVGAYTIQRDITAMEQIISDNIMLQKKLSPDACAGKTDFSSLIGEEPKFLKCIQIAKTAVENDSPVMISGFTGSGKEIFAKSIHNGSDRMDKPFLAINCAALPEGLLESILFGTTRGTFTGAIDKVGLFEQAKGGTLFLDEINSMSLESQAKLLRVLEEKEFRRLGGNEDIKTDVRIISSINTSPAIALKKNQLREDLFYRLSVINISIPPIYDRKDDILLLVNHFISKYNIKFRKNIKCLDDEALVFFKTYTWPGNVRQLKHVIESAINMADIHSEQIRLSDLPLYLFEKDFMPLENISSVFKKNEATKELSVHKTSESVIGRNAESNTGNISISENIKVKNKPVIAEKVFDAIREREVEEIVTALLLYNGNVTKAAKHLNMNRQSLVYRMKKYNINR